MNLSPEIILLLPCLGVIFACICRVDQMRWSGSRAGWVLFYVGAAFVAGDVAVATLTTDQLAPHDWVSVVLLCMYLWMTRSQWPKGQPAYISKR